MNFSETINNTPFRTDNQSATSADRNSVMRGGAGNLSSTSLPNNKFIQSDLIQRNKNRVKNSEKYDYSGLFGSNYRTNNNSKNSKVKTLFEHTIFEGGSYKGSDTSSESDKGSKNSNDSLQGTEDYSQYMQMQLGGNGMKAIKKYSPGDDLDSNLHLSNTIVLSDSSDNFNNKNNYSATSSNMDFRANRVTQLGGKNSKKK
jgi:hypothetical protein